MIRANSSSKLAVLAFVFCLAIALAPSAFGQAESGTVAGTVTDSTGAVVAGATVSIKNVATGAERTATTSNLGAYTVPGLAPGNYEVTVSKTAFASYRAKLEVTVGGHQSVDAQLAVGNQNTVVEVTAGGATEVNTQTQEVSQLIDTTQLAALPSLTRNPYDFVAISGNVSSGDNTTSSSNSSQNSTSRGVGYSINGQRESGTEILLDGAENVAVFGSSIGEQIPVDSVQEYRIVTNNYGAEYGRASGGVVNLTTKSGTNSFHGSVWEFNRLAAYTANTYNNDANAIPKGQYTRNQFGLAAGGPIMKNKLFGFFSDEWTRVRSSSTQIQEVLDPGFISTLPANVQTYFQANGSGAVAPTGFVTAGDLAALAKPVTVGPINGTTPVSPTTNIFDITHFNAPFDAGGDVPQNTYRLVGRLDFNLSDKTQMFFRGGRENQQQFLGAVSYTAYPQYNVGASNVNQSFLYSLNHSFTPSVFDNLKASYTRYNDFDSFNTKLTSVPNLILTNFAVDPVNGNSIQLPGLENTASGLGGLPFGGPQNTIQLGDDVAWIKGRHSMKFGGVFTYIQLNVAYGAYAQAVELLGNTFQQGLNNLTNVDANPGGSPLASFAARVNPNGALPCNLINGSYVIVPACTVTPPLGPASYARSYRYKDWAVYAQDSFRLTPRLTLNYGLRYEHYGVQHNNDQSLDSNFYFGPGASLPQRIQTGQVFLTQKSPVGGFWAPTWGTAAPRIGFAYDVFGDGKTSLRGGFGISYERNFGNVTFNASFNPPASAVISANCGAPFTNCTSLATNSPLGPLGVAGPPTFLPNVQIRMPAPNINTAQTQFWSLALQRELARSTVLEVSYSGAHGVHLYDIENLNQTGSAQFYLGEPQSPGLTRANTQYSALNMRGSLGGSSYAGMNIKLQTQNLHSTGLSLVANYTWSHSLDDLSSTFSDSLQGGSGAIGSLGYLDPLHPHLDWGSSDFDVRNRFVVSPIWETPWFKGGHGFARQALGGWSLVGILTVRSGIPFSVFDYTWDNNGYTVPRLVPGSPITSYHTGSPQALGPNLFGVLTVPAPVATTTCILAVACNPTLGTGNGDGISDFGPFPSNMTRRNSFRGPGAWNTDFALTKSFAVTERVKLEFRAEGFDIFNHHNYYVNTSNTYFTSDAPGTPPLVVNALKGGLNSIALGGNHDERRFGQFALRVMF
jgi:hypothetical protein